MEGAKRVEVAGKDDQRQITALFAGLMTGAFCHCNLCIRAGTNSEMYL